MARSRSSFEIAGAVAKAASLAGENDEHPRLFEGVALVSFGAPPLPPPVLPPVHKTPPAPPLAAPSAIRPSGSAITPPSATSPVVVHRPESDPPESEPRRPPKLPDLSDVVSPVARCAKIIEWIGEATGATDVFLADGSGLPIAGAVEEAEARLAGAGLVAAAVAQLAASLPGNGAPLFEVHLGEGPFFQLVGFEAHGSVYLVGLNRPTPLSPRQAHAIRLACRHALGDSPGGHAP